MKKKLLEESTVNRWKKLARINERDDEFGDDPNKWNRSWGVRREIIKTTVDAFIDKEKSFLMDLKKAFRFDNAMVEELRQMILDSVQNVTSPTEREIVEQMYETGSSDSLRKKLNQALNRKVENIVNQFINSFFFIKKDLKNAYQQARGRKVTLQQDKQLSQELFSVVSDVFEKANNEGKQIYPVLKDLNLEKIPAELVNKYMFGIQINQ
jgi:hypothetical protein